MSTNTRMRRSIFDGFSEASTEAYIDFYGGYPHLVFECPNQDFVAFQFKTRADADAFREWLNKELFIAFREADNG